MLEVSGNDFGAASITRFCEVKENSDFQQKRCISHIYINVYMDFI